jgi:putative ABC transport system substrate-binding protein
MQRPAKTKIGILLWNAQVRYQQCRDGVIDELRHEGFAEPEVAITVEHADAHSDKVGDLARKFVATGMNVIIPIGTSAAVRVAAEIKDIPVVFAFTFDPVASRIARSWKSSGNNTTGSSSKTPAHLLLRWLRQLAPVKRLAVLYTPGERNTEAQLADFQGLKDSELQVAPVPIESRSDVAPAVSRLEGVEALLLTGSSLVGDNAAHIVLLANKARMITTTQSQGLETRVLLGVTVNPTAVGRLAGKKCAMVLRGVAPASIEIEALETSDVTVHLRMAKAIGLNVPEAVKKAANRVLQ